MIKIINNRQEKINKLTNREFLYRSAFELGRQLIGYEIQKSLALEAKRGQLTDDQLAAQMRSQADRFYKEAARLRKEAETLSPKKEKSK